MWDQRIISKLLCKQGDPMPLHLPLYCLLGSGCYNVLSLARLYVYSSFTKTQRQINVILLDLC